MEKPVKIIVYVRGGMCVEVATNLLDDSWEYSIVNFDNNLDLPADHVPFTKEEMKILPPMTTLYDLIDVATQIIQNRESGDLARAIQEMAAILAQIDPVPPDPQNRYTVYGYHTDLKCPFSTWVAACTVDEVKMIIAQQHPTIVVCGVVKGWTRLA